MAAMSSKSSEWTDYRTSLCDASNSSPQSLICPRITRKLAKWSPTSPSQQFLCFESYFFFFSTNILAVVTFFFLQNKLGKQDLQGPCDHRDVSCGKRTEVSWARLWPHIPISFNSLTSARLYYVQILKPHSLVKTCQDFIATTLDSSSKAIDKFKFISDIMG